MAKNVTTINLANDLGYGFAKMCFNGTDHYKIPSEKAAKRKTKKQQFSTFINQSNMKKYINNYMNHLDTTISSASLKHCADQENLVGQSAIDSNLHSEAFNVDDSGGKSSTDLALIITLSAIAGYSVTKYYQANDKLPTNIYVNVNMATALPIMEGSHSAVKDEYRQRYMNGPHLVYVNNFAHTIAVHIKFSQVYVLLEGQAAEFAIWCSKPDSKSKKAMVPGLMKSIGQDFNKYDAKLVGQKIAPKWLVSSQLKTLGIDIGEGTTDFAVFNGQHVNAQASNSSNTGYGNLLNDALLELQDDGTAIADRGHLKDLLSSPTTPFNKAKKQRANNAISHYIDNFINDIVQHMSRSMRVAQDDIDLIYVYGGGSIPLSKYLRKPLIEETRNFNSGDIIPIIFIDKKWAQEMNEIGLQLLLDFAN